MITAWHASDHVVAVTFKSCADSESAAQPVSHPPAGRDRPGAHQAAAAPRPTRRLGAPGSEAPGVAECLFQGAVCLLFALPVSSCSGGLQLRGKDIRGMMATFFYFSDFFRLFTKT